MAAMAAVASRSTPRALAATMARLESGAHILTVSELRAELAQLDVAPQEVEACVERSDLEALLRAAAAAAAEGAVEGAAEGAAAWRVAVANLAAATAADAAAVRLVGMEVPVACGCPASPLAVRACAFARERDGGTLQRPQRGIVNGTALAPGSPRGGHPPLQKPTHNRVLRAVPSWRGGGGGGVAAPWLTLRNIADLAASDLAGGAPRSGVGVTGSASTAAPPSPRAICCSPSTPGSWPRWQGRCVRGWTPYVIRRAARRAAAR